QLLKHISECFIKPKYEVHEAKQPYYLGPVDLAMLFAHYIQQGLLFTKPSNLGDEQFSIHELLQCLKKSLSLTLVHFYPLAGHLETQTDEEEGQKCLVFVDCNKGPGARFIHATLDMTISDILLPTDVPEVVQSFFDHDGAVNYDGHYRSLLTIKVTELLDGVFIGCSMNHALGDGTSYWHFWNVWSETHKAKLEESVPVLRMPIHDRWFPDGYGPPIFLPFTQPDDFVVSLHETPDQLRVRIFHFSSESIARLKSKANEETHNNNTTTRKISSFQALSALYWRSIIRALNLPHNQVTNCRLTTNNRHRLHPPLPKEYFGNCISALKTTTTVGELLEHDLGWAASLLHQSVINHGDKVVRDFINRWLKSPDIFKLEKLTDSYSVMMGSSPRFDMYGKEFGLGKAVAVRRGYADKFVGKVTCYPGYEGGGSVDLEICLTPDSMEALELDQEFMDNVSLFLKGYRIIE
ncbi:protein ENHANCED PSEUDOMONAS SUSCEPTIBILITY 1-like, partial [Spinacia oleracea]|uniref:Protein ENHANCED PSEUDOMONAS SUSCEPTIBILITY 1-like n=1 Tax=Spinacia oleracea TaxID=3562 RepID=A0A9R0IMU6_SPIOL